MSGFPGFERRIVDVKSHRGMVSENRLKISQRTPHDGFRPVADAGGAGLFFKGVAIATRGLSIGAQAAGAASESIGRVSI